jgi:hypothetical protein
MKARYPVIALLLVAASCASPTLLDENRFERAKARWESAGPSNYRVEMRIVCFCDPVMANWNLVTVVEGAVAEVRDVESGDLVPAGSWESWPTVDGLFRRMADATPSEVYARIEAEYDAQLGYPREVQFIEREGVADAGVSYQLRSLEPIPDLPRR